MAQLVILICMIIHIWYKYSYKPEQQRKARIMEIAARGKQATLEYEKKIAENRKNM